LLGRDCVERQSAAAGRDAILRGLELYQATEGELLRPIILSLLADAHAALGEADVATSVLQDAEKAVEALESYGFLPLILSRRAALLIGGAQDQQRDHLLQALGPSVLNVQ
jgi:hypothetical protein